MNRNIRIWYWIGLIVVSLVTGLPQHTANASSSGCQTTIFADCLLGPQGSHDFVTASGSQLVLGNTPVRLKGVNYYPQWRPWATMWWQWNGPQIASELRQARDELGINTVRVLLPYNFSGAKDGLGKVSPKLFARLHEISQVAGDLDMRLVVTLFDFYVNFAQPGTAEFDRDQAYVRAVVGAFADDERIIAWDVHNEPDHYGAWGDRRSEVQRWLGLIADEIHAVAPRQLVTVGMGQPENLWLPGPDDRTPLDYSDLVSVHIYDPGTAVRQLDDLQAHTTKPVVIEEFGWPTDPPCLEPNYTEATQAQLYRDVLAIARFHTSGVLAWTLRDYDQARTMRWNSREEHFGLYRADNTLKPAANLLAQEPAGPLPSGDFRRVPLTTAKNIGFPDDQFAPLAIPGTTFHVKGMFRRAWELMSGRESFGLPLGDAFQRPGEHDVTQYFERAVLVYTPDAIDSAGYKSLSDIDKVRRTIRPQTLTGNAAPTGEFAVAPAFAALYGQLDGAWRFGKPLGVEYRVDTGSTTWAQNFEFGRLERDAQGVRVSPLGEAAWAGYCASVGT